VNIDLFIHAPNDQYVTENTRFWNASGVDVSVGANGFAVKTESLSALLVGGIAFRAPEYSPNDKPAAEEYTYELFEDQQTARPHPTASRSTWPCASIRHCAGSRLMLRSNSRA
jgi:paraquat-inducible protein B